jgi:nucleoid-associated protein YgaU
MKCNDNRKTTDWNCTAAWDRSRQRLHAGAILFAVCALTAGAPVWAQDVAEAARQEQARKDKQAKRQKHVYTEEDLKRARILTREDRELLDAQKREQSVPGAATPPMDLDAQALENLPLGDVARMFRALKELSQAGQYAEFHLPLANAELASPEPVRKFIVPQPRVMQPADHTAPTAPEFPTAATAALEPRRESAMPTAVHEFVVPKPSAVQPTTRPAPVAPVFVDAAAPLTIVVKRGDSFWKLAQVNLGDGHRWHEIAAVNPSIVDPNHLVPGTPINIAGRAPVAPAPAPEPAESQVTVVKGDSLWKIAKIQLGFGGFWGCVAKANPMILDANRIYAGQVLNLPSNCATQREK